VENAATLLRHLREHTAAAAGMVIVGIDGRSGSGKSTLANAVAEALTADGDGPVTVIEGDDFYGGGSAETWDRWTHADRADRVIDWRRQRTVLEQLRSSSVARWHPFDWDSDDWDADIAPFDAEPVVASATDVVLLEGAYSCRPELHDLLDLRVLLTCHPMCAAASSSTARATRTGRIGRRGGRRPRTTTSRRSCHPYDSTCDSDPRLGETDPLVTGRAGAGTTALVPAMRGP
jgi:uridine kinase